MKTENCSSFDDLAMEIRMYVISVVALKLGASRRLQFPSSNQIMLEAVHYGGINGGVLWVIACRMYFAMMPVPQ